MRPRANERRSQIAVNRPRSILLVAAPIGLGFILTACSQDLSWETSCADLIERYDLVDGDRVDPDLAMRVGQDLANGIDGNVSANRVLDFMSNCPRHPDLTLAEAADGGLLSGDGSLLFGE